MLAAEQLFKAIPITVTDNAMQLNKIPKQNQFVNLRGSTEIFGLPILNSGNFENVPYELVESSLAITLQLVHALAIVLNVPLKHPLHPFESFESTISPEWDVR